MEFLEIEIRKFFYRPHPDPDVFVNHLLLQDVVDFYLKEFRESPHLQDWDRVIFTHRVRYEWQCSTELFAGEQTGHGFAIKWFQSNGARTVAGQYERVWLRPNAAP
jgi:hypothetical protein